MADSKLRIIQSYEQGLVPTGLDQRGPTVLTLVKKPKSINLV